MMKPTSTLLAVIVFLLGFHFSSKAGEVAFIRKVPASLIQQGLEVKLKDPEPLSMLQQFSYVKYYAEVRLVYGREEHTDLEGQIDANIYFEYTIDIYNRNLSSVGGDCPRQTNKEDESLTINDGEDIYEMSNLHLTNGDALTFTINCVGNQFSGGTCFGTATIPDDARVEIILHRINYNQDNATTSNQLTGHSNLGDNLQFHWDYYPGAEQYELQYVFIDENDKHHSDHPWQGTKVSTSNVFNHPNLVDAHDFNHYKEPVSVFTTDQYLDIPLVFAEGTVFYRVRSVGMFQDFCEDWTGKSYGPWSEVKSYDITSQLAFEGDKNWNLNQVVSPDGTINSSVTYSDGAGRGRQNTSMINKDDLVYIGNQLFDYEEQASASTPTIPVAGTNLSFHQDFHQNSTTGYDRQHFDLYDQTGTLSSSTGAGKYFSSNNDVSQINQDYIPDSDGYPVQKTQFMRDGTGRPKEEFGIGEEFTGDENVDFTHSIRYFYGKPTQTELQKLFGENVGQADYYTKNMTLDQHGQISFSYYDQRGNLVATSLGGDAPDHVQSLGASSETVTEWLLQKKQLSPDGKSLISNDYIFATIPDRDYSFTYSLDGKILEEYYPGALCEDCEYLFSVEIIDPNGERVAISSTGTPSLINNNGVYQYPFSNSSTTCDPYNTDPNTPPAPDPYEPPYQPSDPLEFEATFDDIGVYRVVKTLTITSDFEAQVLNLAGNYASQTEQQILNSILANLDYSPCDITCRDECITSNYGDKRWDELSSAEKDVVIACAEDCYEEKEAALGDDYCSSLKQDFYASMQPAQGGGTKYDWWNSNCSFDVNGDFLDESSNNIQVNGVDANISMWDQDNWFTDSELDDLLPYHREYCHYKFCEEGATQFEFDMMATNTLAAAEDPNGWDFDPTSGTYISDFLDNDPFFDLNGPFYPYPEACSLSLRDNMEDYLEGYVSNYLGQTCTLNCDELWDVAGDQYQNISTAPNCNASSDQPNPFYESFDGLTTQTEIDNQQWNNWKAIYISLRTELIEEYLSYEDDPDCFKCEYQTDENAIVNAPSELPSYSNVDDVNQIYAQYAGQLSSYTCTGNLEKWFYQLNQLCGIDRATFDSDIAPLLELYCIQNMGAGNPLGLLNEDDLTNSASPLYDAKDALTSWCNSEPSCSTSVCNLGEICDDFSTVYTYLEDGSNNEITFTEEIENLYPCHLELFDLFPDVIDLDEFDDFPSPAFQLECCPDIENAKLTTVPLSGGGNVNVIELKVLDNSSPYYIQYTFANASSGSLIDADLITGFRNIAVDVSPVSISVTPSSGPGFISVGTTCEVEYLGNYVQVDLFAREKTTTFASYSALIELGDNDYTVSCLNSVYTDSRTSKIVIDVNQGQFTEPDIRGDCMDQLEAAAAYYAEQQYLQSLAEWELTLLGKLGSCFDYPFKENFEVSYEKKEHHYTLYYYDQANNLVQTVPPKGVNPLTGNDFDSEGNLNASTNPDHWLETNYKYNTLGQPVEESSPDGGTTTFLYNSKGILCLSQNAVQATTGTEFPNGTYSINLVDEYGRTQIVGQLPTLKSGLTIDRDFVDEPDFFFDLVSSPYTDFWALQDASWTGYDRPAGVTTYYDHTRGRIAEVRSGKTFGTSFDAREGMRTSYDYDELGNVTRVYQDIHRLPEKTIDYRFEQLTGLVQQVTYQDGMPDMLIHRYEYDDYDRLARVYTSNDKLIWTQDAEYFYYAHGPLARMELGDFQIQGMDYYYNLQGWLKGINIPDEGGPSETDYVPIATDPGNDGIENDLNQYVGTDAYGLAIGYYENDYSPIGTSVDMGLVANSQWSTFEPNIKHGSSSSPREAYGLFNGNITWLSNMIAPQVNDHNTTEGWESTQTSALMTSVYQYDQLHRIKQSRNYNEASRAWTSTTAYNTEFSYDANGNILTLKRKDESGNEFDALGYNYYPDASTNGDGNRLEYLTENATATQDGDYLDLVDQLSGNYTYDALGNMTSDTKEGINTISWNLMGKVESVEKTIVQDGMDLEFGYDATGNRAYKILKPHGATTVENEDKWTYIYYVRDAAGNIMASYEMDYSKETTADNFHYYNEATRIKEWPIYGSDRIGTKSDKDLGFLLHEDLIRTDEVGGFDSDGRFIENSRRMCDEGTATLANDILVCNATDWEDVSFILQRTKTFGYKQYELANHLGNVMVTISDRPLGIEEGSTAIAGFYNPDITTAQDYYPFGWIMPERSYESSYSFGFNGMLLDNEVKGGTGLEYNTMFRQYDPRLGRWSAMDPVVFHWESPYASNWNNPLSFFDYLGSSPEVGNEPVNEGRPFLVSEVNIVDQSNRTNDRNDRLLRDFSRGLGLPTKFVQRLTQLDNKLQHHNGKTASFGLTDMNENGGGNSNPHYLKENGVRIGDFPDDAFEALQTLVGVYEFRKDVQSIRYIKSPKWNSYQSKVKQMRGKGYTPTVASPKYWKLKRTVAVKNASIHKKRWELAAKYSRKFIFAVTTDGSYEEEAAFGIIEMIFDEASSFLEETNNTSFVPWIDVEIPYGAGTLWVSVPTTSVPFAVRDSSREWKKQNNIDSIYWSEIKNYGLE